MFLTQQNSQIYVFLILTNDFEKLVCEGTRDVSKIHIVCIFFYYFIKQWEIGIEQNIKINFFYNTKFFIVCWFVFNKFHCITDMCNYKHSF